MPFPQMRRWETKAFTTERITFKSRSSECVKESQNSSPLSTLALPAHNNKILCDIVPIKMYVYMAMGRPVVATRLSGIMKEFGTDNCLLYARAAGKCRGKG